MHNSFTSDFRKFFGKGLAILLPTVLTLWILAQLLVFVYKNVGKPINSGIQLVVIEITPRFISDNNLPAWFQVSDAEMLVFRQESTGINGLSTMSDADLRLLVRRDKFRTHWDAHWYLDASGLIVAIILIYFAGLLLGGFIGKRLYNKVELLLRRLPGFKQLYPHVKQLTELVLGDKAMAFSKAVLVEYPRQGIWTVGLVTSSGLKSVEKAAGNVDVLTIFIPSTPTPFTGFTINVPADQAIDLPIQIDEAVRYFITGGVLIPDSEARPPIPVPPSSQDLPQALPTDSAPNDPSQSATKPDPAAIARQIKAHPTNPADDAPAA